MWHEIKNEKDIKEFMENIVFFHDSTIKELKYYSGAYVDEKMSMYPLNDIRKVCLLIQRQYKNPCVLELEFSGLKYLKLFPTPHTHTCEIFNAGMTFYDDCILWWDDGDIPKTELDTYNGTVIFAEKLRWREVNNYIGEQEVYKAD